MKKIVTLVSSVLLCLTAGVATAQDDDEGMNWFPVETYTCDFREGKGPDDLASVNAAWNEWMDGRGEDTYFAALLWPDFFGELTFDVGWLGAWNNANDMGAGLDAWHDEGSEIGAMYWETLDCTSHSQFAVSRLDEPSDEEDTDGQFVISFSNCSFKEDGGGMEAYMAANAEWEAYASGYDFDYGAWMMFPIYGENVEADYDFKYVESSRDYTTWGANWQLYADGHYDKSTELFEPIVDCDSARVYRSNVVREAADDE